MTFTLTYPSLRAEVLIIDGLEQKKAACPFRKNLLSLNEILQHFFSSLVGCLKNDFPKEIYNHSKIVFRYAQN